MPSSSCCLQCNPCGGMLALFKRRPRALLRRAVGKMNSSRRRRRRAAGSFSSVRAVFWPLMSMRSDADRNDVSAADRPPASSTDDDSGGGGLRAPSPSLDTPASSTTAARVLALQAQLGEAAALAAAAKPSSGGGDKNDGDGVEEACRSFEKHLMEMLVEERKVRDLMDVEELLCCWEKLRSPVFVQLVGRFYGELCMDLFSGRDTDVSSDSEDLSL
uniref:OVATE domain-containing protein n=1 Tax=Oryza meridionalis TaxID=40149 RepID=A0A0E0D764_9ORYZ